MISCLQQPNSFTILGWQRPFDNPGRSGLYLGRVVLGADQLVLVQRPPRSAMQTKLVATLAALYLCTLHNNVPLLQKATYGSQGLQDATAAVMQEQEHPAVDAS